ncbi:MAG: LamG-like jellyroll fold domain-containing protein [Thermoguttaceae bacterium]
MNRRFVSWLIVPVVVLAACRPGATSAQKSEAKWNFASAKIVCGEKADSLERLAAREVQRYLYRISGTFLPLTGPSIAKSEPQRPLILIGTARSNSLIAAAVQQGRVAAAKETLGDQGFAVKRIVMEGRPQVIVTAATPIGVLYGAYTFLEKLGIGFYLGGDTFPGHNLPLEIPPLDLTQRPVFAVRGSLPWYNFLNSPTTWDLDDFKYFFDQMGKMKNNFVGFHTYDSEPFAPYADAQGRLIYAEPLVTSLTYGWGGMRGLRTDQFGFGTGDYFDQELFGSRATTQSKNREDGIRRAQALLASGLDYGKRRGVRVCVGFEVSGDPTRPESQTALEARLRELLRAYPMLDYVWLWQSESLGMGSDIPVLDSPLDVLVQTQRRHFEYLKDQRRIAEAVRVSEYIRLGHAILKRLAPQMRLIVSGWGGDRWMRFSDFYEGFDKTLPPDVIFAALDNIDPSASPQVAAAYGKLSPQRQRWPIPWFESDGGGTRGDQFGPQTNAREFSFLGRDAAAKGCQGLLAIHWRSRDVEEAAAWSAQFAWEPKLSYEDFYRRFACKCFGPGNSEEMGSILRRLEALGPRWTGGGGQSECGYFTWFEGNRLPKAEKLAALKQIRQRLGQIRQEMLAGSRLEGLERLDWLIATIDWLTLYDAAALTLYADGPVAKLVAEAGRLQRNGDAAGAAQKAREARRVLESSGLDRAMRSFAAKMTTRGEFGALATINVKAYAAALKWEEEIGKFLGEPVWDAKPIPSPAALGAGQLPLHIVVKTPPSIMRQGRPIAVRAAVVGPAPIDQVTLGYRKLGDREFHVLPMKPAFRKTYEGVIPGESVAADGIEFYVAAKDTAGGLAHAPKGFAATTYSASVTPWPDPSVFITQCGSLPKLGQDYRVQAMLLDRPPEATLAGWHVQTYDRVQAMVRDRPAEAGVLLHYRPAGTAGEYKTLPMKKVFYDSYEAAVPSREIAPGGIAYYVEAASPGAKWTAPLAGPAAPQIDAPDTAPPTAVADLKAEIIGPYQVRLSWSAAGDNVAVAAYDIHRGTVQAFAPTSDTLLATTHKTDHFDFRVRAGQEYWYAVRAKDAAGNLGPAQEVALTVPKYEPPAAPKNVKATVGRGKIKISWDAMPLPVVGYNVYRSAPTPGAPAAKPLLMNPKGPIGSAVYLDVGLKDVASHAYTVRAIDRGGQEGAASQPIVAAPLARLETPVFVAHFENSPDAESGLKGTLAGHATYAPGVVGKALDLSSGGWIAFPHHEVFEISGELTLEAWVKFDSLDEMPVFLSHGQWRERGFFVQAIGHRIRYSLGGLNDCDAGQLQTGKWYYVVCTYDMQEQRVYLNGQEAGRRPVADVDLTPWSGPFYIGRYTLDGKPYEVRGLIDEVKIYQRARTAEEIRKEYETISRNLPQ